MPAHNALPLFYFQSRICFVDDDVKLLKTITQGSPKQFQFEILNTPESCLSFFENYLSPLSNIKFFNTIDESEDYDLAQQLPVNLDISKIENLSHHRKRFSEISVLIIDQHMPNISGLAICEKLKNTPVKKILMTGLTTDTEVIDAFNHGLIDKFINKNSEDLLEILSDNIIDLNYQYFSDYSKPFLKQLEADKITVLQDPAFICLFQNHCRDNNIVEFYLINKMGHFLLISDTGEKSHFVLMSQKDIDYFILHNSAPDDLIKTDLFKRMKNGELIPFSSEHKNFWEIESSDLRPYFYPAKLLQGRENYFYTIVKKPRLQVVR